MRTLALFGAKIFGFVEIYGVFERTKARASAKKFSGWGESNEKRPKK